MADSTTTTKPTNCCPVETPSVVVATGYQHQGVWGEVAGIKTYITGLEDAERKVLFIYDVWGPAPQTLQGADLLATTLKARILVPDFLNGSYAQNEWFAGSPSPEAAAAKDAFWASLAYDRHAANFDAVVDATGEGKWAAFGLCWGGKMAALASGDGTRFLVSGQGHPGSPTKSDALAMTIPHIALAAPQDNKNGGIDGYAEVFATSGLGSVVETYETMFHGWMGGRANLGDEGNRREFARAYAAIAEYFGDHM